jgi:hypothetical protein
MSQEIIAPNASPGCCQRPGCAETLALMTLTYESTSGRVYQTLCARDHETLVALRHDHPHAAAWRERFETWWADDLPGK